MLLSTSAVHTVFVECRPDGPVELCHGCFWEMRLVRKSKLIFGRVSLESPREASRQFCVTDMVHTEVLETARRDMSRRFVFSAVEDGKQSNVHNL